MVVRELAGSSPAEPGLLSIRARLLCSRNSAIEHAGSLTGYLCIDMDACWRQCLSPGKHSWMGRVSRKKSAFRVWLPAPLLRALLAGACCMGVAGCKHQCSGESGCTLVGAPCCTALLAYQYCVLFLLYERNTPRVLQAVCLACSAQRVQAARSSISYAHPYLRRHAHCATPIHLRAHPPEPQRCLLHHTGTHKKLALPLFCVRGHLSR